MSETVLADGVGDRSRGRIQVDRYLGEGDGAVGHRPGQPRSSRDGRSARKYDAQQVAVQVAAAGENDSTSTAAYHRCPVPVELTKCVGPASGNNPGIRAATGGQRCESATRVVHHLGIVDEQQQRAIGR